MAFDQGGRLGTVFVELDLDKTKFESSQRKILDEARTTSLRIEKNYRALRVTSDNMYQAMANAATNAYTMITNAAKVSAQEQFRAQSVFIAKINALNIQKARNPLFETLGVKSQRMIEEQKQAVISSYNTIKNSGQATAQDLINIEKAKNVKLKELNKEMVGQHERSSANMIRNVLRVYAAYYVLKTGVEAVARAFTSGMRAIDDLKIATVGVAAQITTMQGTTGNITENYRKNLEYAKALVPVLMEIDANSLANFELLQRMNLVMAGQGVILDINNQKQIEAFTALSNAISVYTVGQGKSKQMAQEIRAIMSGRIREDAIVAMQLDNAIKRQEEYKGGLKELVKEGRKHGDTLERLLPYLAGIAKASGDIQNTWESVTTSLKTAWGIIQRGLFADVYKDLTTKGKEATEWLKDNAVVIVDMFKDVGITIRAIYQMSGLALIPFSKIPKLIIRGFKDSQIGATYIIYALADLLAFYTAKWKKSWEEVAAIARSAKAIFTSDTIKNVREELKLKKAAITEQYEHEKRMRHDARDETIKDLKDKYKLKEKAIVETPELGAVKEEEESKKIVTSRMNLYKKLYNMEVQHIDHVMKLKVLAGENEFNFIFDSLDMKEAALNKEYSLQKGLITKHVDDVKERNAQLEVLEAGYTEKIRGYSYQREEVAIRIDNAIRTSTGQMYMDINRYSKESTDYQIAQIKRKAQQSLIKSVGGREGNEVVIAKWESDQILKIREDRNKAILSAELEMLNEINSNSIEASANQIKLWEMEASEYIKLTGDKLLAEEWLQAKINKLNQDKLKSSIGFYSEITGYEQKYRELKLEWIDREAERLAKLYSDDVAAAKWAQQEKLSLDKELTEKKDIAKESSSYIAYYKVDGRRFDTAKEAQEFIKRRKEAEDLAKEAAKEAEDLAKKTAKEAQDLAKKAAKEAEDRAKEAAQRAKDIAEQRFNLEIELMELSGDKAGALAAKRGAEINAMDKSLHSLQLLIWATEDWKNTMSEMISAITSDIDEQMSLSREASQSARQTADQYRQIIESLSSAARKIKGTASLDDAKRRLDTIFSLAMTGEQTALKELPTAIDGMLSASMKTAQSAEEYAIDQGKALLQLAAAGKVSTAMMNWEEYQATLLETQTTLLEQIRDTLGQASPDAKLLKEQSLLLGDLSALLEEQTDTLLTGNAIQDVVQGLMDKNAYYSEQALLTLVGNNDNQIAKLTDIVAGTSAIITAINSLTSVMATMGSVLNPPPVAPPPPTPPGATPPPEYVPPPVTVVERVETSAAETLPAEYHRYSNSWDVPDGYWQWTKWVAGAYGSWYSTNIPERHEPAHGYILYSDGSKDYYARGGDFEGGYRVVGEEGPELEYTGPSHIMSHEKSKSLFDVSEIVAELKELRVEAKKRDEERLVYTTRMSRVIDGFDTVGLPAERA